ncbi:hypothetical protein D3C71_1982990 [compost metagenome]
MTDWLTVIEGGLSSPIDSAICNASLNLTIESSLALLLFSLAELICCSRLRARTSDSIETFLIISLLANSPARTTYSATHSFAF